MPELPAAPEAGPEPAGPPVRYQPAGQDDLAPSGELSRIRANLAALRALRTVQAEQRPATGQEQQVLARWSGWGAVPAALDPNNDTYQWVRDELAQLLTEEGLAAARRTTLNAHYTDAALVQAIWEGLGRLGLSGGRVLEPGCGSGNFIGFAPDGTRMVGVELDPTTAAIAAHLYPDAPVLAESFADTRAREGSFDAAVGNVPFGSLRLHDKRHNPGRHAIHNHFIIKSLRLVRPGGLVAVITSAYTMDATNPAARREMQQLADLVGAVRLPNRAHARAAGTDALTDVLIFRRREDDRPARPFTWEYTRPLQVGESTLRISGYFADRPEMVLGELATGDGLYRAEELSVKGDPRQAPTQLADALAEISLHARTTGLTMTEPDPTHQASRPAALLPAGGRHPAGYLKALPDGTFTREGEYGPEPYQPPRTQAAELRALLRLRDITVELLEAEAATVDEPDHITRLRERLDRSYDAYTNRYGAINRFTLRPVTRLDPATGQRGPVLDPHTGQPKTRRVQPGQGGFRTDPYAPVVWALEQFDDATQAATKADIFRQRVVAPRPPKLGADTPAEALAMVIDELGQVRLDRVAWLLGIEEADARSALGTLVFDDPETGALEPAAAYLSGNVRTKLAAARQAAETDPRFEANVTALSEVLPRDLGPDEIAAQMGAPWIPERYVQQFLTEILEDPTIRVEHGQGAMWTVKSDRGPTVAATSTWGTERVPGPEIAQHVLEQRPIKVFDTHRVGDSTYRTPNLEDTVAANEKAAEMRDRFADWAWEDPQRAADLVRTYNHTFNSYVLRSYQDSPLSLPGLATTFQARPHQLAAVARIINEPGVGLYHAVGAGKTSVMIMAAMELRRLQLVSKPVIVVPNNLLGQFAREFQQLYPRAKVLAATKEDLAADRRRALVARIATGDWDAVIMTESSFLRLPMRPEVGKEYVTRQLTDLEAQIDAARRGGKQMTLKRLEQRLARRQEKLAGKLDGVKDDGIYFEMTGIDYVFRDESDRDKNLHATSNMEGMSIDGSQRASEMDMRLRYLRSRHARWSTRATGTPVANSMVELYTEFRYLRPDLLDQLGAADLDSFLATFAQPVTGIEVAPDGGGLRTKTRVAKFVNVPELLTHVHVLGDVKTADELNLPRPQLAARPDGQRLPEMVVVEPSVELLAKVADLVDRAEKLHGWRYEKGDDNMLKITHEGRSAALDLRLVGMDTDTPQKIHVAADRIAAIWAQTQDRTYLDRFGRPHPTPGALQLVFCDLGTPGNDKTWSVYDELREQLAARGIPRDRIRFTHEATDDKAKWELFQAARDGRINVLVGSTERMGAGTNVQDRAVALHHLDPQWRPRDIEQREGRIWRQGNQNPEIHIIRYVTERSFDAYMWQTLERKAKFIDQIMRGSYDGREAEDLGDGTLSYEEVKAAATGDPLLVDHAAAKAELTRLERLERSHHNNIQRLRWSITDHQQTITINQALIGEIDQAVARRTDTRGKAFTATIGDQRYAKRSEANERLRNLVGLQLANPATPDGVAHDLGSLGGFTVAIRTEHTRAGRVAHLALTDCPESHITLAEDEIADADLVARLENRLSRLEQLRAATEADITRRHEEIRRAERELDKPFRHGDALAEARERFQRLDIKVTAQANESDAAAARRGAVTGPAHPPGNPGSRTSPPDDQPRHVRDPEMGRIGSADPQPDPRGTAAPAQASTPDSSDSSPAPSAAATDPPPQADSSHPDTPTITADRWIAGPGAGWQEEQPWIEQQLAQLANRPDVRSLAQANDHDNFAVGMSRIIEDHLADALEDRDLGSPGPGNQFLRAYFRAADHQLGREFNQFAATAAYQAVRGIPDTRPAASSTPGPTPATANTPTGPASHPTMTPDGEPLAARPAAGPIRLEIDGNNVLVHGTAKEDAVARAALKQARFRWFPSIRKWGLPRNLRPATRTHNIGILLRAMERAGREVEVVNKDSRPASAPTSPAATASLSFTTTPPGPAADSAAPPTDTASPAALARTAAASPAREPAEPQMANVLEAWAMGALNPRRSGRGNGR